MATYVITQKGSDDLDTPVFSAGPNNEQEAVAVFTRQEAAEDYLAAAGWKDQEIAELIDVDLLRWLIRAYEGNTDYLTIDPVRESQLAGEKQSVVKIAQELQDLAEKLLHSIVEQSVRRFTPYDTGGSHGAGGGPGIHG